MKQKLASQLYDPKNEKLGDIAKYIDSKSKKTEQQMKYYKGADEQLKALSQVVTDEKGVGGLFNIVGKYKPGDRYSSTSYNPEDLANMAMSRKYGIDDLRNKLSENFAHSPYNEVRRAYRIVSKKIGKLKKDMKYILKKSEQSKLFAVYESAEKQNNLELMRAIKPYLKKKLF